MTLIDRVKNILLTPGSEWSVIIGETPTVQSLYAGYIIILAAIGPVAMALRFGFYGFGVGFAVVSYATALVMAYVLAWVIDALAPSFGGEKNFIRALQLVAFSFTAAWLGGIFHLLGNLGSLLSLVASIYSIYTFYLGAPVLRKCSADKAVAFTIVVVITAIVLGAVLSWALFSAVGGGMNPTGMHLMR